MDERHNFFDEYSIPLQKITNDDLLNIEEIIIKNTNNKYLKFNNQYYEIACDCNDKNFHFQVRGENRIDSLLNLLYRLKKEWHKDIISEKNMKNLIIDLKKYFNCYEEPIYNMENFSIALEEVCKKRGFKKYKKIGYNKKNNYLFIDKNIIPIIDDSCFNVVVKDNTDTFYLLSISINGAEDISKSELFGEGLKFRYFYDNLNHFIDVANYNNMKIKEGEDD